MKKIVEVPDDFLLVDPYWLIENIGYDYDVEQI